jgi:hypothetical protein
MGITFTQSAPIDYLQPGLDSRLTVLAVYTRDDPNFLQGIEFLGDDCFIENGG